MGRGQLLSSADPATARGARSRQQVLVGLCPTRWQGTVSVTPLRRRVAQLHRDEFALAVVAKPTKIDSESWDYVSQEGTTDQVVALMNRTNVRALDLDRMAF